MANGNGKLDINALLDEVQQLDFYANRDVVKDLPIGKTWVIQIRALPTGVVMHLQKHRDEVDLARDLVRFGVVGWRGLQVPGGEIACEIEEVDIWGRKYPALTAAAFDNIPPVVIPVIRRAVDLMAQLSLQEQQALDFTQPSAKASAGGKGTKRTSGGTTTSQSKASASTAAGDPSNSKTE